MLKCETSVGFTEELSVLKPRWLRRRSLETRREDIGRIAIAVLCNGLAIAVMYDRETT